jgi:cell wall-active antibiotic response 4TMS protein YvqF
MTEMRKSRAPWFAVALILVGAVLLLDRLDLIRFGFQMALWSVLAVFGLVKAVQGFSRNQKGSIFGGTVAFLYGLFFLLRSSDYVDVRMGMFFPATFLIFGIALLMMFLNNYHEWELLIPAGLLGGIGVAFVLSDLGYLDRYDVWEAVRLYWPLGLVLLGLALLLRRRAQVQ